MSLSRSSMSLLRLGILAVSCAGLHYSFTPPTSASAVEISLIEKDVDGTTPTLADKSDNIATLHWHGSNALLQLALKLRDGSKYFVWVVASIEGVARLLSAFPTSQTSTSLLPILLPSASARSENLSSPPSFPSPFYLLNSPPTPSFLLSAAAVLIGASLRKACFDALGRLFTFTHTTLAEHRLVQDGPYAVVRHPSYVGSVLVRGGIIGVLFSAGSWAKAVGAKPWPSSGSTLLMVDSPRGIFINAMRIGLGLYLSHSISEQIYLLARASKEDETLKAKFGLEWEEYRRRVPWRFIPYII